MVEEIKTKIPWIKQKGSKTIIALSIACLLLVGLSVYLFTQINVYYGYGISNVVIQQTQLKTCFLFDGNQTISLNISSAFS